MKKIINLIFVAVTVFTFTACGFTPQEDTPPVVEIIQRTNLMDFIKPDYILNEKQLTALKESGITPTVENPRLTGENSADFDLVLTDTEGKTAMITLSARIDYDKNGENFENVRIYRGEILNKGKKVFVPAVSGISFIDFESDIPEVKTLPLTEMGIEGTVVKSVVTDSGYISVTSSDNGEYLIKTDFSGEATHIATLNREGGTLISADSRGILPFDTDNRPEINFTDKSIFVIGDNALYAYDTETGICRTGLEAGRVQNGGVGFALYRLTATDSRRQMYAAVKSEKGTDTVVTFDRMLLGNTSHEKTLDTDGGYKILCRATGMEMDVDFKYCKAGQIRYKIPQDALGERMYISTDRKYSLYRFAPEQAMDTETYSVALMENATGKITNLGCAGTIGTELTGETGFGPDGNIYILNNDDLTVYTTDVENPIPVYRLSDNMEISSDIFITAATINEKTKNLAVVYFNHLPDHGEYVITLLDSSGKKTADYPTGIQVASGNDIVTVYPKGNNLVMTVTDGESGKTTAKGTLDTAKGVFQTHH